MSKIVWFSAAVALTLALAGCGESGEEGGTPEQVDEPAAQTEEVESGADEVTTAPPAASDEAPPADEAPVTLPEEEVGAGSDEALTDDETESETLGESPVDALEEGGALPGEPTRSDIEAILEDTERRFEEAQRQIDQQFEELDQSPTELEPMESGAVPESSIDPMTQEEVERSSAVEREAERSGELSQSDVDAWLEESERRFEEARRQLDEQFEEVERSEPGSPAPRSDEAAQ